MNEIMTLKEEILHDRIANKSLNTHQAPNNIFVNDQRKSCPDEIGQKANRDQYFQRTIGDLNLELHQDVIDLLDKNKIRFQTAPVSDLDIEGEGKDRIRLVISPVHSKRSIALQDRAK